MNSNGEDFELMSDMPKEDAVAAERRRSREDEITKKLGDYLLKGYCMLSDNCENCNCILLRTPDQQLLCVACNEIDIEKKQIEKPHKKKPIQKVTEKKHTEPLKESKRLEAKLQWAVTELKKTQSPARIKDMCDVIIKLTETIKVLKQYETMLYQE